jgi:hypothetical protein
VQGFFILGKPIIISMTKTGKFLISCVALFAGLNLSFGQQVLTVNLDRIETITSNISSENYYPSLKQRFITLDSSLSNKHVHFLYYGQYFEGTYQPDKQDDAQKEMFKLIKKGNFDQAVDTGLVSFNSAPLNLRTIFGLSICYLSLDNKELADKYMSMYYQIMEVVMESGTGRKKHKAFVTMCIDDEYEIISSLNKKVRKQKLIDMKTDVLYLTNMEGRRNIVKFKKIYFNVEILMLKSSLE